MQMRQVVASAGTSAVSHLDSIFDVCAGLIADEMVDLLCANLQKDELAAVSASMGGEDMSDEAKEAVLKVRRRLCCSPCMLLCPGCANKCIGMCANASYSGYVCGGAPCRSVTLKNVNRAVIGSTPQASWGGVEGLNLCNASDHHVAPSGIMSGWGKWSMR